jgi:hypothetical protein
MKIDITQLYQIRANFEDKQKELKSDNIMVDINCGDHEVKVSVIWKGGSK